MDFHIFVTGILLLTCSVNTATRNKRDLHIGSLHLPSFWRGDVETNLKSWHLIRDRSASYLDSTEFGSRSLPLRNAVEQIPDVFESTERLPLRDAVEKRPPPDEAFDLESEPEELDLTHQNGFPFWTPFPEKYSRLNPLNSKLNRFEELISSFKRQSRALQWDDGDDFFNQIFNTRFNADDPLAKNLVCYVESAAGYRRQPMTFYPENVDPFMCSHLIYAYAAIDPHSYDLMTRDEEYDLIRGAYRSVTGLKRRNPKLKVLISVVERNPERFNNLTSNPVWRRAFIESSINFSKLHNFDGLDFNWHYHTSQDLASYIKEREDFSQFLSELSSAFKREKLLIFLSAPIIQFRTNVGFDPVELSKYVDFVNIQTYDFHNSRNLVSQYHASLVFKPDDVNTDGFYYVERAISDWIKKGLPRSKIIVGIPFFGRSFTIQHLNNSEIRSYIRGPGKEGYYTQNPGFLAYYEICSMVKHDGLVRTTDSFANPYITYENQWISFEDPTSIAKKISHINKLNLGGIYVWSLDLDDFRGICDEKWPLMSTVRNFLNGGGDHSKLLSSTNAHQPLGSCKSDGAYSDPKNCANYYICRGGLAYHLSCGSKMLFDPNLAQCSEQDVSFCRPGQTVFTPVSIKGLGKIRNDVEPDNRPKVVCYVTNWSFYRKGDGKFVPEYLNQELCTHVVYAFATLEPEQLVVKEFDPWADIENSLYERVTSLKGPKVLLALGGWTDSVGDKYSRLVSNGANRHKFVVGVISFLRRHGFQGLHLDWNYPICWQSNCKKGPASDKPNFTKLIQELRREFDRESPPMFLAVGLSGYKEVIDVAYDLSQLGKSADFLSVMTYDYHGNWEKQTGHVSPLYQRSSDQYPQYNTNFTMEYLVLNGAPREKLLVGIPFYGQTFTLIKSSGRYDIGSPTSGPGEAGEYSKQPGMLSYYEICNRIKNQRWTVKRDDQRSSGPYATYGNQWVGYDDPDSIKEKAQFIKSHGFGGAVAWTVDLDDFQNKCCQKAFPLLRSLNVGLGLISRSEQPQSDCSRPPIPITPAPPVMTTGFDTGSHHSTTDHHHEHDYDHTSRPTTSSTPWWASTASSSFSTVWWVETTTASKPFTWWSQPTSSSSTTATPTKQTTTRSTTYWWQTTQPTESTTIPTPAVVMPEVDHDEPVKCETGQYLPDPYNCNAYYRCVLGELQKQYCAGGLHWNREQGVCDWPAFAKCEEKSKEKEPTTSLVISTTTPTTTLRTRSTTRYTEPTTRYTEPTTRYTYPTTRYTEPTTQRITTFVKPTTTTRPSDTEEDLVPCTSGEYYPHEQCSSFYVCVNGQLVAQKCAPGLQWNIESGLCDWVHNTKCLSKKRLTLASETLKMVKQTKEGSCQGGTYTSYPGDCSQYLFCLWNKYESFSCSDGLHWNNERQICDWPENANCVEENNQADPEELTEPSPPAQIPTKYTTASSTVSSTTWSWTQATSTSTPVSSTTNAVEVATEPLPPHSGYYKIVCYFTNWAWYRKGIGKYVPEDIDENLCTHIIYGFAVLDYEKLTIKAHDSWADFDNNFYTRVVAFKKKGLKVLLAIGGWNDSMGDKYSRLVNNPSARARFIKHVLEFLDKYDFDGLDLDWEYPKCWQVDCKKGPDSDKPAFAEFIKELKTAFEPKGLLLSSAVSPSKTVIDAGYDVPALAKYLDWVAVMTYDFHGQWDKQTGHVAPLYYHPDDEVAFFNANYSINYWISEGVSSRKIVMGMPLYGQSFQLENSNYNSLNAKAPGPGQAGEYTRAAGFLAYYEICDRIKNKDWTVVQDPRRRMGPYAYKGNQWVSFDDKEMIRLKSEYVRKMNLGGGMIWALDLDDFNNRCGEGKHPLLRTIRQVLAEKGNNQPDRPIEEDEEPLEPDYKPPPSVDAPEFTSEAPHSTTTSPNFDPNSEFKVVCYFTNWAWYRQGVGKYLPGDIDPDLCTHIIYGFAVLNGDQLVIKPHDSWADYDNKFYEKVTAYKSKGIKVLIAIGGWNDSAGDKYSRLVNNPSSRARFITDVVEFIEKNNFDGLDLDWEYPKCWQVDCNKGPESDKYFFAEFVKELHHAFKPKGLLLSSAVSPSKRVVDAGYDVPVLSRYLDWIAVMCYDYHGQWDKVTGHVAPMYAHPEDEEVTFNTNFTINYWINKGADRKKIVMGMPTYGQSFSLRERTENGLNAPAYGGGEAGEETRARGFLSYYEICSNIIKKGWTVIRDKKNRMGPYAYSGDQWVSFDDIDMIRYKSEFIKNMGLGGGMIWALDLDDFKNICNCENYPLLRTINRVLRGYKVSAPTCNLLGSKKNIPSITHKPESIPSWQTTSTQKPQWHYTSPPEPSDSMACRGNLFIADETNCNQYYLCNQNKLMLQSCPVGLYWNKDHCDWPENSECHPDATTHVPPSTISIKPEEEDELPQVKPTYKPSVPGTTINPDTETYKVICYFTNWAWYRQERGKYVPEDIDPTLCTHINYGFAVLDSTTLTIKPHDSWADIDNEFYTKVISYKKYGIKVLIALGGWNDSLGDKYSRLVNDPQARARFVKHISEFIEKWGFDGLDLDWEYPKCWQVDCNKGPHSDKQGFADLIRELSAVFKPRGWLLSSAVSPSKTVIDAGYDVPILNKYFDWIAVMTYDFHGHWDKQTGHVAPLYYYPGDVYDYFNANFSLNYWIEMGASPSKIIMGMPLYGQSFSLAEANMNGLNEKSYGPGEAGEYTRAGGFMAFYEICERVKRRSWTVTRDPEGRIGPYAVSGNQWVSYDDIAEIRRKSKLLKELRLGGGMVWALDLDDFKNVCGCGKHPLLKALNNELRGVPVDTHLQNCT